MYSKITSKHSAGPARQDSKISRPLSLSKFRIHIQDLASKGLSRQEIFDQVAPPFKGRERDIADIISATILPKSWKKHGWSYIALFAIVLITTLAWLTLCTYFYASFSTLVIFTSPLILANAWVLWMLINRKPEVIEIFGIWSSCVFIMGLPLLGEGRAIAIPALAVWALTGFIFSRVVKKKLFGNFKHSARRVINAKGQTVAINKIRFLN